MKILYHHRTRGTGVEAVHIRGVVSALRGRGHGVDVVGPPGVRLDEGTGDATGGSNRRARGVGLSATLWRGAARTAPETAFELGEVAYNGWALPLLEARLAGGGAQLIYERYALFLVAGALAARRRGVPLILEVNDSARLDRIRPLHYRAAARRTEDFAWHAAGAVVTVTDYFRDLLVESGVPAARVVVLPNAVDEEQLSGAGGGAVRERLGLRGCRVAGYLGALNRWRRLDLLIGAFAALAPRLPDARLLLVGDGPDREALRDQACAAGIADRVLFTGEIPHAEVPSFLAAIDVAVLPHSNVYGSPMKLFEYLGAGRAVIAPRLPPVVPLLASERGDDEAGLLFDPFDERALRLALERLLTDEPLRARLGARGRRRVLEHHQWSRHGALIEELALRLLAERDDVDVARGAA